ncbi:MAG TPA: hypothetical protein VHM90_10490 [Phycisphaerae bacterium]|nr:hypothetical protein [Phycisphaerae bacterium]
MEKMALQKKLLGMAAVAIAAAFMGASQAKADTLAVSYYTVGTFSVTGASGSDLNPFVAPNFDPAPTFSVSTTSASSTVTITSTLGSTTKLVFNNIGSLATPQPETLFSAAAPIPFFGSGPVGTFSLTSDAFQLNATGITLTLDIFQIVPLAGGATSPQLAGSVSAFVFFDLGTSSEGSATTVSFSPFVTSASSTPPVTYQIPPVIILPINTTGSPTTSLDAIISAPNAAAPLPSVAGMGMTMLGLAAVGLAGRRLARPKMA